MPINFPLPLLFLDPKAYPAWARRPEARRTFSDLAEEHLEKMSDFERCVLNAILSQGGCVPFDVFFDISNYGGDFGAYTAPDAAQKLFKSTERPEGAEEGFFDTASRYPQFAQAFLEYAVQIWEEADCPSRFLFCEMGAGNGSFAEYFMQGLDTRRKGGDRRYVAFAGALNYHIIEKNRALLEYQRKRLSSAFPEVTASLGNALSDRLPHIESGIFFSNELIDMFPPRKIIRDDLGLWEINILVEGGMLHEVRAFPRKETLQFLRESDISLKPGQSLFVQTGIRDFIFNLRKHLQEGVVILCDYGHPRESLLASPAQSCRRYLSPEIMLILPDAAGHHPLNICYPGDLTVDVDWTTLRSVLQRAGFQVNESLQADFLKRHVPKRCLDTGLEDISLGCRVFIGR